MIPPVQLWLGSPAALHDIFITYAQQHFCKNNACGSCIICTQIKGHQFHGIKVLAPDKMTYSVSYLDDMLTELAFKRDAADTFFYVFTQAHLLTIATANRLLKKFEEPAPGYAFILCAESKEMLPATILSRSVIHDYHTKSNEMEHALIDMFMQRSIELPAVAKIIEKDVLNDAQTRVVFEALIQRLHAVAHQAHPDAQMYQERLILCTRFLKNLPMPGGSKLFWRSLFLSLTSQ